MTDDDQFAGMDLEHVVDDGPGGAMVTDAITIPWTSAATATQSQPSPLPALTALPDRHRRDLHLHRAGLRREPGGRPTPTPMTPTAASPQPPASPTPPTPAEDTCTTTSLRVQHQRVAARPARRGDGRVGAVHHHPGAPGRRGLGHLHLLRRRHLARLRHPDAGNVTQTQQATSYSGSTPVYTTESTATYDEYGRTLTSADADNGQDHHRLHPRHRRRADLRDRHRPGGPGHHHHLRPAARAAADRDQPGRLGQHRETTTPSAG